jgi:2-hydroxy-6-oxonona-2,4-dienedioate hydrolase
VSSASLLPLAGRLAERRRAVLCDSPGRSIEDAAAGVSRFLDGGAPAVLVGHSYGCLVAARVAARHPDRVAALVFLSPAFDRRFGSVAAQFARLLVDLPLERPSFIAAGLRDWWRAGPSRLLAMAREAARSPLEEMVAAVPCPVLVVRGGRDPLTTGRWARELARATSGGAVAVVPGAAHGLGHEAPVAVARAVDRFVTDAGL